MHQDPMDRYSRDKRSHTFAVVLFSIFKLDECAMHAQLLSEPKGGFCHETAARTQNANLYWMDYVFLSCTHLVLLYTINHILFWLCLCFIICKSLSKSKYPLNLSISQSGVSINNCNNLSTIYWTLSKLLSRMTNPNSSGPGIEPPTPRKESKFFTTAPSLLVVNCRSFGSISKWIRIILQLHFKHNF